jgi:hypothetical protein
MSAQRRARPTVIGKSDLSVSGEAGEGARGPSRQVASRIRRYPDASGFCKGSRLPQFDFRRVIQRGEEFTCCLV